MTDAPNEQRLAELEEKLSKARGPQKVERIQDSHVSQAQAGWRMVTELVVGLLLGFGLGYGFDVVFGTKPVFILIMTLLGFAAGVRVMMRTAEEIQKENAAAGGQAAPAGQDKMYDDD